MAATAYKGVMKIKTSNGGVQQYPFTASDIADAHFIWQDGSSELQLPLAYGQCVIVDVMLSAAGVDTSQASLIVNAKETGVKLLGVANITTAIGRQFQNGAGVVIAQGAKIDFVQKA
jgi:hypothetical protein